MKKNIYILVFELAKSSKSSWATSTFVKSILAFVLIMLAFLLSPAIVSGNSLNIFTDI